MPIDSSIYWKYLDAMPTTPKQTGLASLMGGYDAVTQRINEQKKLKMQQEQYAQQKQMQELQMRQAQSQMEREKAAESLRQRGDAILMQPQSGPYAGGYDDAGPTMQQKLSSLAAIDPDRAIKLYKILDAQQKYNAQGTYAPKPEKVTYTYKPGDDGYMRAWPSDGGQPKNTGVRAKESQGPTINLSTGEKSVANEIGGMMKEERIKTSGALKALSAADQIEAAIKTGMVNAGPMANGVQTVNQLLVTYAGKDPQKVTETRKVIKNLAVLALEARKQLQGQGQVTENEAAAVARAESGEIDQLTVPELQDLVNLTRKANTVQVESWKDMYSQFSNDFPQYAPYYKVAGFDDFTNQKVTLDPQKKTAVRTGTINGRKVIEYSDGTVDYAE